MNNISSQIKAFTSQNIFSNNLDTYGNINLHISASDANQVYVACPLLQYDYDIDTITQLYDTHITAQNINQSADIIQVNQELQNSYNTTVAENQELRNQLGNLIAVVDANPAQSEVIAQKDLIIKLRIQLGQGSKASDFSSDYPYAPVTS